MTATYLEEETKFGGYWSGNPPVRLTKFVPFREDFPDGPHPRQHAGMVLNHIPELLFGGAAGGGKSDWLLMEALQYVDIPDYAAILFRRTFTDLSLPGALMDRSLQWLRNTEAQWDANQKRWTFPSGATITFAYLEREDHKFRYQSAEFQFVGFDELTQFTETQYLYLFSRLRRLQGSQVPIRMRAATNPGGRGHPWVKARFRLHGNGLADNEANLAEVDDHGEPMPRLFIKSTLEDNPALDQRQYERSLSALDPFEAAQLRHGDWDARPPGDWFFEHEHITAAIKLAQLFYDPKMQGGQLAPYGGAMHGCIDWGENTHALPLWKLPLGSIYVPPGEVAEYGAEPGESSRRMITSWSRFGFPISHAHYDAAGVQSMRTFVKTARLNGYPHLKSVKVPFGAVVRSTGKSFKAQSAGYLRRLLMGSLRCVDELERTGKMPANVRHIAISPHNPKMIEQLKWLEKEPEGETVWKKDEGQHGPDALVAGVAHTAVKYADAIVKEAA
jgi:hypothetical protein